METEKEAFTLAHPHTHTRERQFVAKTIMKNR
jgi:hypothetical protein